MCSILKQINIINENRDEDASVMYQKGIVIELLNKLLPETLLVKSFIKLSPSSLSATDSRHEAHSNKILLRI